MNQCKTILCPSPERLSRCILLPLPAPIHCEHALIWISTAPEALLSDPRRVCQHSSIRCTPSLFPAPKSKKGKRLEEQRAKERKEEASVGASGICCLIARSGYNHMQGSYAKVTRGGKQLILFRFYIHLYIYFFLQLLTHRLIDLFHV